MITGAGGGLGSAMTLGLLADGARVCATDHPAGRERLEALAAEAARRGMSAELLTLTCDVTDEADCATAVRTTLERFGTLTAVVNNAGLHIDQITPYVMSAPPKFFETSAEQWRRMMDVNVNGPFLMALAAVAPMVERGWGRIVNVTTGYRVMVRGGSSAYGPSKAALESATCVWAADLAGTGVTVNVLSPGLAADTAMVPTVDVPDRSGLLKPEALVPPICFLTSERSDAFTGRRFTARLWSSAATDDENVKHAGELAGWRGSESVDAVPRL